MATTMWQQSSPPSSGEIQTIDPDRAADIEAKHRLVGEFLERHGYDALLLEEPQNFAWFTSGGDATRRGSSESTAALFITPDARVAVTNNVDSGQLFDRELHGMGFQLKERPWPEPGRLLVDDLCRGRSVAGDVDRSGIRDISVHLTGMRIPLTDFEARRLADLGRGVAHAVEATCRQLEAGRTEADVAGELAHRLLKQGIRPDRLQVAGDGRGRRYRHWTFTDERVDRYAVVSAVGQRHGLLVSATRTVSFGEPPREIRDAHHRAVLMQATGMFFSQREWELFEIWNRVERIYEKFNYPNEWRLADQAEVIGYYLRELPVVPNSEYRLTPNVPVHWHPSVGPALVGDTVLVGEKGFELLTPMEQWPRVTVKVKGVPIPRPDILRRDRMIAAAGDSILSFTGLTDDSALD
ncbi:MAG TPA: M24 family metallopeptidase [Planctomycetaceae bacterium]|nr:M24 family metallopeptidase [Planctomycetaceae bacterium]